MHRLLRWVLYLSPIWLTAILGYIGSFYTFQAAVAHFTTPEINSYMEIETVSHASDGAVIGVCAGTFLAIGVYFMPNRSERS